MAYFILLIDTTHTARYTCIAQDVVVSIERQFLD